MIYLGSPQMSAVGTGLKKRPNYVDIINAQTPFLPALKAQELEADYQKQTQEFSEANLALEEDKLALAKDTQAQQQQQAKTSNMIGLAGLGVNTGLGYLQAQPYLKPAAAKIGSLLGLGTSTAGATAAGGAAGTGFTTAAAVEGLGPVIGASGVEAGALGAAAGGVSAGGAAAAGAGAVTSGVGAAEAGASGAGAATGAAGGASLTTTLAGYIAPVAGGYIGSEIGGKIAGENRKQEGQMLGGMVGGAATGAAVGAVGGPIGAGIGAIIGGAGIGAIIGGFVGILSGAFGAASQKSTFNPAVTFRKPMYLESSYRSGLLTKEDVQGFLGADWQPSSKGWNITGAELPSPMWGKVFNEENRLVHLKMLGVTNPLPLSEINKATEEEKTKMDAWRNTMAGAQWAGSGASVAQVNVNL